MENSEENELITDRIDSYELGQQEDWEDEQLELYCNELRKEGVKWQK